jgi:DNA-directed RNA polymerase omega subunit
MIRNSSEQAVHKSGSPFGTVNAIVKRSRQLLGGAPPLVTNANPEKPAMTALREIAAGVVQVHTSPYRAFLRPVATQPIRNENSEFLSVRQERQLTN